MANQGTRARDFWLGLIVFVVLAVGGVAAIYFIFRTVLDFLTKASPQLSSALVGTAGLVFVAVIANFLAKIYEQRQRIQEEQRAKKVAVYEEFMEFWVKLLTSGSDEDDEDEDEKGANDPETQAEIQRYLREFTHKLVAWGSEPFIREYVVFKDLLQSDVDRGLLHFEKVLLEIRRDIGYKNKKLNRGDLLKVFLERPGIDALIASEEQTPEASGDDDKASEDGSTR